MAPPRRLRTLTRTIVQWNLVFLLFFWAQDDLLRRDFSSCIFFSCKFHISIPRKVNYLYFVCIFSRSHRMFLLTNTTGLLDPRGRCSWIFLSLLQSVSLSSWIWHMDVSDFVVFPHLALDNCTYRRIVTVSSAQIIFTAHNFMFSGCFLAFVVSLYLFYSGV